jgi:hypothetical protein
MRCHPLTFWSGVLVLASAVALTGCPVESDIGTTCTLVRRDPADTDPTNGFDFLDILESEVTSGWDFISIGSAKCDEFVCVRDKSYPKGPNPGAPATGYCSKACSLNSPVPCPVNKGNLPPGRNVSCRSLILDESTLTAICRSNPDLCRGTFGDIRTSYYCVMSGSEDGGT